MIGEPNEMISHLNPNNKFTSCQRILRRKNSKPFREIQLESLFVPPISNASLKPMTSLAGRLVIIEGNIGKSQLPHPFCIIGGGGSLAFQSETFVSHLNML